MEATAGQDDPIDARSGTEATAGQDDLIDARSGTEATAGQDDLIDALVTASFATMAVLTRIAAEHDLSLTQLRVLAILRDRRVKMTELAGSQHKTTIIDTCNGGSCGGWVDWQYTTVMNSIAGNENRTHAFHEASIKRDQLGQKPDDHMTSAKVSQECSSNDCLDHYIRPHLLRFRPEI